MFFPPFIQQSCSESYHVFCFFPNTPTNQDGMIYLVCEHSSDHVVIKLTETDRQTDRRWLNDTCQESRMRRWTNMRGREKVQRCDTSSWDGGASEEGWLDGNVRSVGKTEKESKKSVCVCLGGLIFQRCRLWYALLLSLFFLFATSHMGLLLLYPRQSCSGTYGGCHSTPQPITLPVRWIHPLPRAAIHIKTSKGYERKSAY